MEFLDSLQFWHWFILAIILIASETLGSGGFLIGIAIAAILTGILDWFAPGLSWQLKLAVFAFLAVVLTFIYWRFLKPFNQRTDNPDINDRVAQLVGRILVLQESLPAGPGRLQIGDTLWRVETDSELARGTKVVISGSRGMVLLLTTK